MLRNDIEMCKIERPQTVTLFEVLDDFQNYNSELRQKQVQYRREIVIGTLIMIYGLGIFIISMYNPFSSYK